jgi:hypothetical protein
MELNQIPFTPWPKTPRIGRAMWCMITEKIDGTNAQIVINDECKLTAIGSRNRWIKPGDDNYGFAAWVVSNQSWLEQLLGPGTHFGEWWGSGIQRGYGLGKKRFSLFNAFRWRKHIQAGGDMPPDVDHVPILFEGEYTRGQVEAVMADLARDGSVAAPGFGNPEGVCIHINGSTMKHTFDGPKWEAA